MVRGDRLCYLVGLGAAALVFALARQGGLRSGIERARGLRLLPAGHRLGTTLPAARA